MLTRLHQPEATPLQTSMLHYHPVCLDMPSKVVQATFLTPNF
jgi:hypothetical protein